MHLRQPANRCLVYLNKNYCYCTIERFPLEGVQNSFQAKRNRDGDQLLWGVMDRTRRHHYNVVLPLPYPVRFSNLKYDTALKPTEPAFTIYS